MLRIRGRCFAAPFRQAFPALPPKSGCLLEMPGPDVALRPGAAGKAGVLEGGGWWGWGVEY